MAPQPTGDATLTDKDLDEAVESMFEEGDETPTAAPETAPEGDPAVEAVVEPDTAQPADAAAGDAPPADVVETRPEPVSAVPAIPAGAKPFQFKASGTVQTLPGAHELPDGSVLVTKDALTEVRRTFANERDLSAQFTKYRRESDRKIRDAQTQRTAKDAEADAVIAWGAELAQKTPEELWQHLNEFQGNVPRYQLDLERRRLDEQRKQFELQAKGPQLSEEEQREQFTENVQGELAATFAYLDRDAAFKGLTPEDKQTLRARWEKRPELLVRRATEDMPQHGITKGDVLFDPSNLLDDAKFILAHRKPVAQPSKAAAQNAIKNADQQVTNRIPPTARSAPPVAQQPRDKTGKFTDRKQFAKDFMADDDE
jgi:hypothetical protein